MDIASDSAIFFVDHVNDGCGWHTAHGRIFLCRKNGPIWENALINHCVNFPEDECEEDGNVGFSASILWVEPEDWKPLNLAPMDSPKDGMILARIMISMNRFKGVDDDDELNALWDRLIESCSGKTHREVLGEYLNP